MPKARKNTKKTAEENEKAARHREERLTGALRWTAPVESDVPIPSRFGELSKGFLFNAYSSRAELACSSSTSHNFGGDQKTTTQGAKRLFSSRSLALKAMRYATERECAEKLLRIDEMIAQEEK